MRKLFLFMMVSLDGFFEGPNHDLSWHNVDDEFNKFAIKQLNSLDTLIFGRRTYELMASYWPTDAAKNDDPVVAAKMNSKNKIVVSNSLSSANWENSRILSNADELSDLKKSSGKTVAIFGSNQLCVSLMENGLIDEFRIMVAPVAIGSGTPLFHGISEKIKLKLLKSKKFKSGNVLLTYAKK